MRISINLATRPFVELRPLFARLRIAMGGLAVVAIGLAVGLHFLSLRAHAAQAQMDDLKAQTLAFQTERQTNERRMQQPQNRAVLDRSKFLNALFERKSFSWTSVMMDLERVLPSYGVQVTDIEPVIQTEGDVNIRLRVSGDRDRAIDLVRNLEQSQRFLQPRLSNETAQTHEGGAGGTVQPVAQTSAPGAVEFDILSGYNPLPTTPKGSLSSPASKAKQGSAPPATKPAKPGPPKPVANQHPAGAKPLAIAPPRRPGGAQ
jgi:type IV pilus assembly protein PilN